MSNIGHAPNAVVMIRPHQFVTNPQTSGDNAFQQVPSDPYAIKALAYQQVTAVAELLMSKGVEVILFEDETDLTPDSVFPNNWFTTHNDGALCVYPMYPENRRLERRQDVLDKLINDYQVNYFIDYSHFESQHQFLEGTGAMVLDHDNRIAYAVRSHRCSEQVFNLFCRQHNFQGVLFDASDNLGNPIYHTNVLMCVASDFVMISDEMIRDTKQRAMVVNAIQASGKQLISLTEAQINQFAGNALELQGKDKKYLALSTTAQGCLTDDQRNTISSHVTLLPCDVTALEYAGGSIRCMLAGIHLHKK